MYGLPAILMKGNTGSEQNDRYTACKKPTKQNKVENLIIKAAIKTPEINFNAITGKLSMKGRSVHENPHEFYNPVLTWMNEYSRTPRPYTDLTLKLEHINTSSSKYFYEFLKILKTIKDQGNAVTINWLFDEGDEDIKEVGEEYSGLINMPFEFFELEQ